MAAVLMVVLCAGGVGFLVCFFIGTCKKQACVWICYLLRTQPELQGHSLTQQKHEHERPLRAA
jgi:hypothetical protein